MKALLRRIFAGLAFRVAALLALALFPIGIIAVYQTEKIEVESARRDEAALLALTAEAAGGEERLIRAAFGSLAAFASAIRHTKDEPGACDAIFVDFIAQNPQFSFAGYVSRDGILSCASGGKGRDVSANKVFIDMRADPKLRSVVNMQGSISKKSVIAMLHPVMSAGAFDGYVAISLPHDQIAKSFELLSPLRPIELITFNERGEVLSAEAGLEYVKRHLPRATSLLSLVGGRSKAFSSQNGIGERRVFAVVPVLENNVYAIGSWSPEVTGGAIAFPPLIFPALMWLTSFAVAYFAVHRLAIVPIKRLGRDMNTFIRTGHFSRRENVFGAPAEMRDIDKSWQDLAETVLHDKAQLENSIQDKTVLLKELHHRVKNNLQLISSIVSLKTRTSATPDARTALKDIQMRLMSMSTVHRALYETSTEGRVRADELLRGIAQRTIDAGSTPSLTMEVVQTYDPVTLFPDQAVPLSLLATETITNALKYIGNPPDAKATLSIRLGVVSNSSAFFEVENSKGTQLSSSGRIQGTGVGNALINAFVLQAGGTLVVSDEPHLYRVRVDFPIVNFHPEPVDVSINMPNEIS